ncbi:MAG: right-handed parallel beta-helix repeat-containing protein [Planctomycetes bacterium]|nr:right-handed parallel beta-helix repeat-containing protein [Planctomycetota bacterium]MBU4400599.1 right-handed parallel beta-helix repeat-containing protein [Planctomycetota bacterium]MCG2684500.1 right-handed parallel beta-helix repeat-containing protein [Planctomycetales bacterium]
MRVVESVCLARRGSPRLLTLGLALAVVAGAVSLAGSLGAATEATAVPGRPEAIFYVAPNGRDGWSGTLAEPNGASTDGPFATLARARDAIRQLKVKSGGKVLTPLKVLVRGGKYFFTETLVFTPEDSGTREFPVAYTAYPGEKPVLSGGRKINGWQPYKGRILQCSITEAQGGKWKFNQLFFDGKRQVRARYPNADPQKPWHAGWLPVDGPAEPESFVAFKYKADAFPRHWAKPTQGDVFMIMDWGYTTITPIRKIDEQRRSITMTSGVRNFDRPPWVFPGWRGGFRTHFGFYVPFRFFVENLLEELDQPGEWCLDADEGKVYFWPPEGPIESHETVASELDCLISLRGASWITISGLTLTETVNGGDNMHRSGYEGYGAMFLMEGRTYCGEAVHLKNAEYCRIADNCFAAVGGNAVYLEGYNFKNVIRGNQIAYAGHCGVGLIGKVEYRTVVQHPLCNEITDNHIHHCGVFNKVAVGVFCGVSDGNVIGHNLIEQMPHHAINLGNHGYGRNIVEFNDIRHTCQESLDNAAVNCWMENNDRVKRAAERSGHVFRFNRIADTPGQVAFGLYLDNTSSNCLVYGNIILRSGLSGIRINGGKNNLIENNIIVSGGSEGLVGIDFWNPATAIWPQMKGFMTANRFSRNIVYCSGGNANLVIIHIDDHVEDVPRVLGDSDYNLFFAAAGGREVVLLPTGTLSLAQWKNMGYDTHSLVADPLFVDPAHDDYRLKPNSPALKLGFQPIDVTQIGPRAKNP